MLSTLLKNCRPSTWLPKKTVHTVGREPVRLTEEIIRDFDIKRSNPVGREGHDGPDNMILSKNLRLALDTKLSHRNVSTILYGRNASNAYFAPNILQADASYIVQDICGELYRSCSDYLKEKGYDVKCVKPEELSAITREEILSYGFVKKALFVDQPMGDFTNAPEISRFFSDVMKILTFNYEKNERALVHTVHTAIMIPDLEVLPVIPALSESRSGEILGVMRLYRVSLNIGVRHRSVFMSRYRDTYPVIEGNCDSIIYLGDIGCAAWNEKNSADKDLKAFFMDSECLVAVRGTTLYIDEQYNVYADKRYRN